MLRIFSVRPELFFWYRRDFSFWRDFFCFSLICLSPARFFGICGEFSRTCKFVFFFGAIFFHRDFLLYFSVVGLSRARFLGVYGNFLSLTRIIFISGEIFRENFLSLEKFVGVCGEFSWSGKNSYCFWRGFSEYVENFLTLAEKKSRFAQNFFYCFW